MTLASWCREFYPKPAMDCVEKEALQHSLRKWKGLRKENLELHGVSSGHLEVNSNTCALCRKYYKRDTCPDCPLTKVRGTPCDQGKDNPFEICLDDKNPESMIALLEKAIENAA